MDEETQDPAARTAGETDVSQEAVDRLYYEQFPTALWPEVAALPLKQRWAFLLHLEPDELMVFTAHGCCSYSRLAEALEISLDQLAELYRGLPLPDDAIAARLQVTQRQVINLRKCARERLSRRLKMWGTD